MAWRWGRKARIHREASAWVIRMRGPAGPALRDQLDAWRATSPEHDRQYRDAAWIMQMSAGAERVPSPSAGASETPSRDPRPRIGIALAALAGAAAAGALYYEQHRDRETIASTEFASASSPRSVRLADGSVVTLDQQSIVSAHFDGRTRAISLVHGSAQFAVAHDAAHPFIVTAADRQVTARGTIFRVALKAGAVSVVMLEGVVDVRDLKTPQRAPVRLVGGQRLDTAGDQDSVSPASPPPNLSDRANWSAPLAKAGATGTSPDMIRTYDATPLSVVLADANQGASKPIRLGALGLSQLHVEGRFETQDTRALAQILAAALDLRVEDRGSSWVLTRA